jgi:F-type H+-transporting ATPase subunit delta
MTDLEPVARPYAQAIFELARESGTLSVWSEVLSTAGEAVQVAEIAVLLDTPGSDIGRLADLIAELAVQAAAQAPGEEIRNLLQLIAENRRLRALPAIAARFEKLRADAENTLDVMLTAATPVDPAQQARMAEALKKRFGREINLQFKLDENLIGGARLQADDLVIDGSVRTGLEKLASALVH